MAFLALTAIILASGVNLLLQLWITQSTRLPALAQPNAAGGVARDFESANDRNLFAAKRDLILAENAGSNCDNYWDAKKSSLSARLVGTAVFELAENSLAFIEDSQKRGVEAYSIRECKSTEQNLSEELRNILGPQASATSRPCNLLMGSAIIKRIETLPDRVFFYNESSRQCEYISSGDKAGLPIPRPKPAPAVAPSNDQLGKSIQKTGPSTFEIDGGDLDNILNNLSMLLTQARIEPAFEDGKPVGFRFVSIQPNSAISKIGFEVGDVLAKINGYDMSPEKGLELLQKLQTDSQFNVEGKRGGNKFSYEYNIKR